MVKLKTKIVEVDSSFEEKKKTSIINLLISIIILLIILSVCYIIYTWAKPYINAVDIEKIAGRRIVITECNTKDYLIIGKDKAYSMSITNENCEKENYDGNIIIKNNTIIFNEKLSGKIDNDYNIIINNTIFKSDKNG